MTLTIELTPEEEATLQQAAREKGQPVETLLRSLIASLPTDTEARRLALLGSLQGRFAHIPTTVEDFHREKHAETARETL